MRKTKLIALLLVITMILLSVPVSATYNPTTGNLLPDVIPADVWTLSTVFHWVVRGETLKDIAIRYGTNIEEIKFYNSEYFADLANRNTTKQINIELEHGVRLKIYDQVTVKHYVRRGETLFDFTNGYFVNGSFELFTTKESIINQNKSWFDSLAKLNVTRNNPGHELEESYDFWDIFHNPYYADDGGIEGITVYGYVNLTDSEAWNWGWSDNYGTPLYITVPVQLAQSGTIADPLLPLPDFDEATHLRTSVKWSGNIATYQDGKATDWYRYERHYYMRDWGERDANPALAQWDNILLPPYAIGENGIYGGPQIPFYNALPTNYLPAVTSWSIHVMGQVRNVWLKNYAIPGFHAPYEVRVAFAG